MIRIHYYAALLAALTTLSQLDACAQQSGSQSPTLLTIHRHLEPLQPGQEGKLIAQNPGEEPLRLSKRARLMASQLGILELIENLYKAKYEETDFKTPVQRRIEILKLRMKISDSMRHALLQVQDAIAAIEWDLAHTLRLYDYLDNKKSKYDQITNVITFVTSGVITIVNGAVNYIPGLGGLNAVSITGISSGIAATSLPLLSFRRHEYANPDASTEDTNMLAQIFNRPTDERTTYNALIWKHLTSPDPRSKNQKTRRQRIVDEWSRLRSIRSLTPEAIGLVTGTAPKGHTVSLNILDIRADLLSDLRAEIADYYRDIAVLQSELIAL